MSQPRRTPNASRTTWFYRLYLLKNPVHTLVFVPPAALGILTLDVVISLASLAFAELVLSIIVPSCAWAQRAIDERLEQAEQQEAAEARAKLLERMTDDHRREFNDLEATAALVRRSTGAETDTTDCLGIERLLAAYIRIALAQRATAGCMHSGIGTRPCEDELAALETERDRARGAPKAALDRRLAVVRARAEAQRAAREEQLALDHDLATISHTIRWMREHCAFSHSEAVRSETMQLVDLDRSNAALLRDLTSLNDTDAFEAWSLEAGDAAHERTAVVRPMRVALPPPPPPAAGPITSSEESLPVPFMVSAIRT